MLETARPHRSASHRPRRTSAARAGSSPFRCSRPADRETAFGCVPTAAAPRPSRAGASPATRFHSRSRDRPGNFRGRRPAGFGPRHTGPAHAIRRRLARGLPPRSGSCRGRAANAARLPPSRGGRAREAPIRRAGEARRETARPPRSAASRSPRSGRCRAARSGDASDSGGEVSSTVAGTSGATACGTLSAVAAVSAKSRGCLAPPPGGCAAIGASASRRPDPAPRNRLRKRVFAILEPTLPSPHSARAGSMWSGVGF